MAKKGKKSSPQKGAQTSQHEAYSAPGTPVKSSNPDKGVDTSILSPPDLRPGVAKDNSESSTAQVSAAIEKADAGNAEDTMKTSDAHRTTLVKPALRDKTTDNKPPREAGETSSDSISVAKRGTAAKAEKQRRQGSEVSLRSVSRGFQQLSPDAVRLLREVYSLLDGDGSGSVSRQTVHAMLASIGLAVDDAQVDQMLTQTGDPMSFAAFAATMSDSVSRLPAKDELTEVLEVFKRPDGTIDSSELRAMLHSKGLSDAEIDPVLQRFSRKSAKGPMFDAQAFVETMSV